MRFPVRIFLACIFANFAIRAAEILPNTQPLTWTDDLSTRMHEAAHKDVDRMIADSIKNRAALWHRDFSSSGAYEMSIKPNREHFARIIGLVDQRLPVDMERVGDAAKPENGIDCGSFRAFRVRWSALDGVYGEGWLLEPKAGIRGLIVALPDADQTPESICGLDPKVGATVFARNLAASGFLVVAPTL